MRVLCATGVVSRQKPKVTDCQNISKASTGLRTISARIRNVKAELQDLGEEMDDQTDTVPKYREMLLNLSGVDIFKEGGTEFKSTYQILKELASVWSTLNEENRAAITTQLAGTRQTNVFEGIIHNFQEAEGALEEMQTNAAGATNKAMQDVLSSVEGVLAKLKAAWEEFSNNVLNSKFIVATLDVVTAIIDAFNTPVVKEFTKDVIALVAAFYGLKAVASLLEMDLAAISPQLFLIATAFAAAYSAYRLFAGVGEEKIKYAEKFSKDLATLKETEQELESLQGQYESTIQRLSELNKLKTDGTITTAQEEELIRLKNQNTEYEKQIAHLKTKKKLEEEESKTSFRMAIPEYVKSLVRSEDTSDQEMQRYLEKYYGLDYSNLPANALSQILTQSDRNQNIYNAIRRYGNPDNITTKTLDTNLISDTLDLLSFTQGIDYIENAVSEYDKEINQLKSIYEQIEDALAYLNGNFSVSDAFNSIIDRGRDANGVAVDYKSLVNKVTALYDQGKLADGQDIRDALEPAYQAIYDSLMNQLRLEGVAIADADVRSVLFQLLEGIYTVAKGGELDTDEVSFSDTINSISALKDGVSSLSSAFNEFTESGAVSFSTLSKISEAFSNVSGIEDYVSILSSANLTQEQLSNTLTELGGKYLENKVVTGELKDADEELISSMLKEAGVANASEAAHQMVTMAKIDAKMASIDFSKATAGEISDLINEVAQLGVSTGALVSYVAQKILSNQNQMNEVSSINQLLALASAAGAAGDAVISLNNAKTAMHFAELNEAEGNAEAAQYYRDQANRELQQGSTYLAKKYSSFTAPTYTYTGSGSRSSGGGSGSKSGGSSDNSDPWKEAYDQEKALLDYQHKMERITDKTYYQRLDELNKKYFAGRTKYLDEYRSNMEEIHDGLKSLFNEDWDLFDRRLNALAEDDYAGREKLIKEGQKLIISESKRYRKELAPYLTETEINNSDFIKELGDKWGELTNQLKQLNIDRLSDQNDALDQIIQNEEDMLDRSAGKQIEIEREKQRQIEKTYKNGYLTFKEYIEQMNDSLAAEMDALQSSYDTAISTINTYIDEKIDALQNENDELEKQKELQDSLNELEKARAQRNKRLYVEGIGFIWTVDQEAIKTAEDRYNELTSSNALDEEIKYWEDLKTSLEEILGMADEEYDNDVTEMLLGKDWKSKLEEGQLFIKAFADAYISAIDAIRNKSVQSNSSGTIFAGTPAEMNRYIALRGYADGGVANFTGIAKLHGTPSSSETIFNSADSAKLYSFIHDIPSLTDYVYHNMIAGVKASNVSSTTNGVNIDLGGIVINGNADQTTIDSMSEMLDRKIIQMSNMIRQTSLQKSYNQWGVN